MCSGTYKIAETVIRIESVFPQVHTKCAAYEWAQEEPAVTVRTGMEDIAQEQVRSDREARREGIPAVQYPDHYLEELAVYRKMAQQLLAHHDTLLFHGSCLAVDDRAVLFTAVSGTGKSTHTRLWRSMLGARCVMVNDDKPLLRIREDGVLACGTPWNGKHDLGTNCQVPLKAICILERGVHNEIVRLTSREALPMLLQQSFQPENGPDLRKKLQLLDLLTRNVEFYRLRCNMDPEAAEVSYRAMLGEKM